MAEQKAPLSALEAIVWTGVGFQEIARLALREIHNGVPPVSPELSSYITNYGDLFIGFSAGLFSRVLAYRALEYVLSKAAPASKIYKTARFLLNEHILNSFSLAGGIATVELAENTPVFDWINTRDPNDIVPGIIGAVAYVAVRYLHNVTKKPAGNLSAEG